MFKKIKNFVFVALATFILSSCGALKIGNAGGLTIASTKNVNVKGEFVLLARNAGFDESQMLVIQKKIKVDNKNKSQKVVMQNFNRLLADDIEQAINNVVESVPGGVFMENVEVYVAKKKNRGRLAQFGDIGFIISGDVYGIKGVTNQVRGYIVGSKALYKGNSGTVATVIDDQMCLWKNDKTGNFEKVLYDDLIKIGE